MTLSANTDRLEQTWLTEFGAAVRTEVHKYRIGSGIRIISPRRPKVSECYGWWIQVCTLPAGGSCELWLDRYAGYEERKLWYGVGAMSRREALKAADYGTSVVGAPATRTVDDSDFPNDALVMTPRLAAELFERPLLHLHVGDYYGYGFYIKRSVGLSAPARDELATRVAHFFVDLAYAKKGMVSPTNLTAAENRVLAQTTRSTWERTSRLMNECKRRDKYTCQLCTFNFEQTYGRLGKMFAHAHHVVSLASQSLERTTLDDLMTVCANCHAMLGRAVDGPDGVAQVRAALESGSSSRRKSAMRRRKAKVKRSGKH